MSRFDRILVVDDEPGTVRVLGAVLEDAGFRVESASNGRIALEMLEAAPHDIVLLDFLMPHLDGCETLRAIRQDRRFAAVRVVMMSGVTESIVARRARASYDAFLHKPFSLDELIGTVRSVAKAKAKSATKVQAKKSKSKRR